MNLVGDPLGRPKSIDRAGALLMRTWSDGEAAMIRQLLAAYGIPCQVVSDVAHSVLPICIDGLGEVRILVSGFCLGEAQRLLAEHRRQGLRVLRGGKVLAEDRGSEVSLQGGG